MTSGHLGIIDALVSGQCLRDSIAFLRGVSKIPLGRSGTNPKRWRCSLALLQIPLAGGPGNTGSSLMTSHYHCPLPCAPLLAVNWADRERHPRLISIILGRESEYEVQDNKYETCTTPPDSVPVTDVANQSGFSFPVGPDMVV